MPIENPRYERTPRPRRETVLLGSKRSLLNTPKQSKGCSAATTEVMKNG